MLMQSIASPPHSPWISTLRGKFGIKFEHCFHLQVSRTHLHIYLYLIVFWENQKNLFSGAVSPSLLAYLSHTMLKQRFTQKRSKSSLFYLLSITLPSKSTKTTFLCSDTCLIKDWQALFALLLPKTVNCSGKSISETDLHFTF